MKDNVFSDQLQHLRMPQISPKPWFRLAPNLIFRAEVQNRRGTGSREAAFLFLTRKGILCSTLLNLSLLFDNTT